MYEVENSMQPPHIHLLVCELNAKKLAQMPFT